MLETMYREVILYYSKNPENKGLILNDESYKQCHLLNPSCGDEVTIQVKINNSIIEDARHDGKGCSICCASSSILTKQIKGLNLDDCKKSIFEFLELVKGQVLDNSILIKEAMAFSGVKNFPARIRCASIAWKALEDLLTKEE